jgi:hypothetical protein
MAGMVIWLLVIFNFSWSACPEAPTDLGYCDTLHVVPFPTTDTCIIYAYPNADPPHTDTICINNPGEKFPCFLYVNLLVTHDSNTFWWEGASKWVKDSISAMVVPLGWTRTNPAKYCSLSTYWNENVVDDDPEEPGYPYPRRIWRNFPPLGGDSINWMGKLKWSTMLVDMSSDSVLYGGTWMVPPHAFITLIAGANKKKWSQERDTLLATLTFRIEDTMHVCIDSTFYPPASNLTFTRYDAESYVPRNKMPLCIWVGPPRIQVLSPNGGDTLCVGSTKDITWLSEKFTDPVKIEYSTDGGQNWTVIVASTPNDGVHTWTNVPNSPSTNCRVKVSDAADGEPKDSSDAPFTIIGETIAVTYPIGGEFFVAGDPLSITWNSACFVGSVDILMSEDGGTNWDPIASGTENDGIYPTSISQSVSTDQGLIKVSDSDDGIPSDLSDGLFTVRNFTIRAKPETLVVSAGEDTSCRIILESQFGFNLPCTLTVSEDSLPAYTTYDLDTLTVVPTDTAILTFHTESSTPSCTSHVIVTGTKVSGPKNQLAHGTEVILIVTGPPADFSIDASPETLWVTKGDSTAYTVDLDSIYGFSSPCSLSVTGLPTGAKGKFVPSIVTPPGSSILAINTYADSIAVGEYELIITGRNGSLIHSDSVIFKVEQCTSTIHFTFTETDSSFTIIIDSAFLYQAGLEECDEIAVFDSALCVGAGVYHHPGKTSQVLLAWRDNPATLDTEGYIEGHPMLFKIWSKEEDQEEDARPHFPPGGDSTFGPPGDTSVVWLEAPIMDFAIDVTPDTLRAPRGYSGNYKIILTRINGFASNCTLSVVGHPAEFTATFDPPVLVPPTDSSLLTLTIPADAVLDTFTLTITAAEMGKGEGIAHTKDVTLIVTLPTWVFEVDAFPDTQIISQGGATNYDVTIIPTQGFTAACTLFVEFVGGLPSGVTADFDSNPIPPNDTSTLTITTLLSTPPDTYDLAIIAVPNKKQKDTTYVKLIIEQATDVDEEGDQPNAPDKFALFQNQPNPFNPETKISYYLSEGCEVKLIIYNILGRRVKTLFEGHQNAGMNTLVWDGKNDQGEQLSSGIYFYRLQAGEFIQTKKMNLLK